MPEILRIEKELAKKYGRDFPQDFLEAGVSYVVKNGKTERVGAVPGIRAENVFSKASLESRKDVSLVPPVKRAFAPVRDEERDVARQDKLVLGLLNGRFLATKLADVDDNLKNLVLQSSDGTYRVLVRFGTSKSFVCKTYAWDFSKTGFVCEGLQEGKIRFDEDYWANDLEDFFEGTQELYSNFLHKLDSDKGYRLWTVL